MPEILGEAVEVDLGSGTIVVVPTEQAPVTEVNGKTGKVKLDAADVHALSDDTKIPEKISDLENDGVSETVATYADLLTSTENRVHVLDISDGLFGLRGDCWFEKTNLPYAPTVVDETGRVTTDSHSSAYAHRTSDGAVMIACPDQIPLPPPNAPAVSLGACIGSYYRNSQITYGNSGGLFNDEIVKKDDKYQIDCSMFANAVLDGITFPNSRYSRGTEAENLYGEYMGDNYLNANTRKIGFRSHALGAVRQAEWFSQQKRLFRFPLETGDYRDAVHLLRFGDVIFSSSSASTAYAAYGISHVQIVLRVFDDGTILTAEVGGASNTFATIGAGTCQMALIDFKRQYETGNYTYQVFARPNYGGLPETAIPCEISSVDLGNNGDPIPSQSATNDTEIAVINMTEPFVPGEPYTLILKGKLPSAERVWYEDGGDLKKGEIGSHLLITNKQSVNMTRTAGIKITGDTIVMPFIYPAEVAASSKLGVRVEETALSTVTVDGETVQIGTPEGLEYQITAAAVVRGIAGNAAMTDAQGVT